MKMNPLNFGISIWLGAIIMATGDPSAIAPERRMAVSAKIAKAFSHADSVSIASLEPTPPYLLERFRPKMAPHLRKDLLEGRAGYGSLTLDIKSIPKYSDAVISSIDDIGTPRLGFCWSPRHAIIIRKAKEPEIVVEICYECGGMRLKDGEDTLTFNPPISIHKDMDGLFDAQKIPRSTPIKRAEDGTGQPATRPESKSEGGDKPQPEAEGRSR